MLSQSEAVSPWVTQAAKLQGGAWPKDPLPKTLPSSYLSRISYVQGNSGQGIFIKQTNKQTNKQRHTHRQKHRCARVYTTNIYLTVSSIHHYPSMIFHVSSMYSIHLIPSVAQSGPPGSSRAWPLRYWPFPGPQPYHHLRGAGRRCPSRSAGACGRCVGGDGRCSLGGRSPLFRWLIGHRNP